MRFLYILSTFSLFLLASCGPSQAEIEAKRLANENLRMRYEMEQQKRLADSVAAEQTKQLAEMYINEKALGKTSLNDAYHIAIASVNRLDCLISWNFKHIVNFDKIKLFNSINMKLGYPLIDIRTPLEFLKDETDH